MTAVTVTSHGGPTRPRRMNFIRVMATVLSLSQMAVTVTVAVTRHGHDHRH